MKSFKCICCNKKIERLDQKEVHSCVNTESDKWRSGEVNKFYCGYGSRHDDNTYLIAICDDCIQDRFDKGVIIDITVT